MILVLVDTDPPVLQAPHRVCLPEVLRGFRASVVQDVLLGIQFPLNVQILTTGTNRPASKSAINDQAHLQSRGPWKKICPLSQSVNFIPHHEKRHVPVAEVVQEEELGLCKS